MKFIPKSKLSKKAKKALNAQSRISWSISPTTRKSKDKTKYDRKKVRIEDDS
ncbi:MAG: hypothetical protein IJO93_05440 [Clostridia bacterium]|nr:hypothetical protein [Clostridia bacterium]